MLFRIFSQNKTSDNCSKHRAPPPTKHTLLKWVHSHGCEACLKKKKARLLAFHLKSTEKFFTKEVRSLKLFFEALGESGILQSRSIWSKRKLVVWFTHRTGKPTQEPRLSSIIRPVNGPLVMKFLHKAFTTGMAALRNTFVRLRYARIM